VGLSRNSLMSWSWVEATSLSVGTGAGAAAGAGTAARAGAAAGAWPAICVLASRAAAATAITTREMSLEQLCIVNFPHREAACEPLLHTQRMRSRIG
jgi:hypothetical protein